MTYKNILENFSVIGRIDKIIIVGRKTKGVPFRSGIMVGLSLFFIIFAICNIAEKNTHGLQQAAGPIIVKISPGETKAFHWGLLNDKNQYEVVTISADADGAQFLSFPKNVTLTKDKILEVPVNVTIPTSYNGNLTLHPMLRATEAGENNTNTVLNIEMAKTLSILIMRNGQNSPATNTTNNQ